MDPSGNIFSYCVGALALISAITSVLLYCRLYLPTSQLKQLDDLLLETKSIYVKANNQRLLVPDVFAEAQRRLSMYEDEYDRLREATYRAITCIATLRALFQGQTRRIMELAQDVRNLRSFLMTMSQREKERKTEELRRTQANHAPEVDRASENNIELESDALPFKFINVHDDKAVSTSRLSNFLTFGDSEQRRNSNSTRSSLPIIGWWTRKACQSEPSLPTYIVHGEFECPHGTITATSTQPSTLVDEPITASSSASVYPPPIRVGTRFQNITPVAPSLSHSAQDSNPDDAPCTSHEQAVELSV